MPDSAIPPFISMDLNGNPGVVSFQTPQEFQEWLKADLTSWQALRNIGNLPVPADHLIAKAVERMKKLMTLGREITSIAARKEVEEVLLQYRGRQIIHHSSPIGEELFKELKGGIDGEKNLAAITLAVAIRDTIDYQDRIIERIDPVMLAKAAARAHLFEVPEFRTWFEEQREWTNHISASIRASEQRATQACNDTEQKIPELKKAVSGLQGEVDAAKQSLEAKIVLLEKTAKEWLRLDGVYDYWRDKKELHSQRALFTGIILFGALITVLVVTGAKGAILFPAIIGLAKAGLDGATNAGPALGVVVATIFAVPLLAGMWLLRLLGRILFSNLAQSADAWERMVMLKTFLALAKDGNINLESDRSLILQALFRAGPGAGSDDGLLSHPMESAVKMLGGKGKD